MKKRRKSFITFLLMISMITTMITPGQTVWAKTSSAVNRGQVCQTVNKLLGATKQSDKMKNIVNYKKGDDYYKTMSIAYNAGYITANKKNELGKATEKATYNYVAGVFSKILGVSKNNLIGKHKSSSTMNLKQFETYVTGIIPNIIAADMSDTTFKTNTIINTPNVTLNNVTFNGNLVIGDGVADQEVILNNVTVTGKLIVRGGGENSIKIYGTSNISSIDVKQVNNKVSIKVSDDANVQMVYINDGCNDVTLYGPIGTVNVTGNDINVSTNGATISNVVLSGENTSFTVSENTVVNKVALEKTASNAQLNVTGTVTDVSSKAANSTISVDGKGSVEAITADKTASGTEIKVAQSAVVNSITSDAKETVISGTGKVEQAVINGDNSKVSTPDTKVTVGENAKGIEQNTKNNTTPAPSAAPSTSTGTGTGSGSVPVITPAPAATPTSAATPTPAATPTSSETPTPTATPTSAATPTPTVINYKTDERFAADYPQISVGSTTGSSINATLRIKLKDGTATAESPATVYYVVSTYNASTDTSSTAVIHGHLGMDYTYGDGTFDHQTIYASNTGAVKITNADVVDIPLNLYTQEVEGIVVYFVIKTDTQTSVVPTKVEFTNDVASSFIDKVPPFIYSNSFCSDAVTDASGVTQRTIRAYLTEAVNPATAVTGSAFTVSAVSGSSITGSSISAVSVHASASDYFDNYIQFTLSVPEGTDLNNIMIFYNPPISGGFSDSANIPNRMYPFTIMGSQILNAEPVIKEVDVSLDGKYISAYVSPRISNKKYTITVNGNVLDGCGYEYSYDYIRFFLYDPSKIAKADSYDISIAASDGSKITDVMGKEYSTISTASVTPVTPAVTLESAVYDTVNKMLTVKYSSDNVNLYSLQYGCQYVLNVDGKDYRLRGYLSNSSVSDKASVVFKADNLFDAGDFSSASSVTLTLSPLSSGDGPIDGPKDAAGKPLGNMSVPVTIM